MWNDTSAMKRIYQSITELYYLRTLRKIVNKGEGANSSTKLEAMIIGNPTAEKVVPRKRLYAESLLLDLHERIENRTLLNDLLILQRVLLTRGRLRWLCYRLLPEVFGDAYRFNRVILLTTIFKNWNIFRNSILGRIELNHKTVLKFHKIEPYEYTHPDTQRVFRSRFYVLENELNQRLVFQKVAKHEVNQEYQGLLLKSLILRDSQITKRYLKMNSHLLIIPNVKNVISSFPQLQNELDSERQLKLEFHDSSTLNFDTRLASKSKYPDSALNVEIWHQRFIVQDDHWVVIDSTCSPYQHFVAGHWQFLDGISRKAQSISLRLPSNPKSVHLEKAIYLIGRCDENWFHLIMDTLPRYLFMNKIGRDVPVLIRSDLPTTSIEFLRRVISNPLILVKIDVRVKVKTLYFLAGRSTTYDTRPRLKVPQVDFSPKAISLTRHLVMRTMTVASPTKCPKRFYLPRESKYRNLLNSRKIFETLEAAEFQRVEVNQDFFRFQQVFFNNAKVIIAPGGAILANMIFMNAESRLIVFRSIRDLRQGLWKKLSKASNVNLTQIFGVPTYYGYNRLRRQHSDFYCSVLLTKLIIKRISK